MLIRRAGAYPVYLAMETAAAVSFALVFTVNMVYQVEVVGLGPLQLVLVGTMLEAVVFIFEIPTGVVADVYSRRVSIVIGWLLIGAGFFVEGTIPRFEGMLLGQVLWGLGYTFTSGATEAWIADEIGEDRAGGAYLRAAQAGQVGGLAATFASAALGSLRLSLPILLGGCLFMVLGIALALIMPERGFRPATREERQTWRSMGRTLQDGVGMIRLRPALLTILVIGAIFGASSEGFDRLWTPHLLHDITLPTLGGLSPVLWFGIIRAVGMVLSLAAAEIARRRVVTTSHFSVARALLTVQAGLVASVGVFAVTRNFPLALAMLWVIDPLREVKAPLYTAWVNQRLESRVRATVNSMAGQVDALGQILGGPALGLLAEKGSVAAAILAAALLLSPGIALFGRTLRVGAARAEAAPGPG
jgi:DHA3 family tetracycline resistance protein-like MFS transporter